MYLPPKVTRRAFERLSEINAANEGKALRIAVEGGGCSGFQYEISLGNPTAEDLIIEEDGEKVIIDSASLPFLENAIIDYSDELIGARFVIDNPNATSSCGCVLAFQFKEAITVKIASFNINGIKAREKALMSLH